MFEKNWHALGIEATLEELQANLDSGLSKKEAEKRLQEFGYNKLKEKERTPLWKVFLQQFNNFVVFILIAAAIISLTIWAFFGQEQEHLLNAGVIMLIVIINAILGLVQEYRAEKAMEALKKMTAAAAIVIRQGIQQEIDAREIVPGDIVLLKEGKRVAADARIIEAVNLKIDEASLTGESVAVEKHNKTLEEKIALADRKNLAFMNTIVTYGRGKAIVVATGMETEFGKIAGMLQEIEKEETPLMQRLQKLGAFLAKLVIAITVIIFVLGVLTARLGILEMFLVAVSLAVAAIPEGLPAIVTITLALGMNTMARNKAIIRKMSAVETLGSTSVICSDKTGTITKNEMTVTRAVVKGTDASVTGEGYSFEGKIKTKYGEVREKGKELEMILKTCVFCNDANIGKGTRKEIIGDPTEIALLFFAAKAGYFKEQSLKEARFVTEKPFESERKRMSVCYEINGKKIVFCKGSVESVLGVSSLVSENGRERELGIEQERYWLEKNDELAMNGLRVLGFAFKEIKNYQKEEIEADLIFLGIAGMIDAPREEVKHAIRVCEQAGIEVKMVTGDHKLTAIAVAKEIGIMREGKIAVTGQEIEEMSDNELEKRIENIAVFARVNPSHKVRIVQALEKKGAVTAMTGDGVNDAPALKKADIGVAMGITGTDVSKEASEMVIADDNFATIVKAVAEGRKTYTNIKAFVKYLLSANTAEVIVVGSVVILGPLGLPLPLVAVQILWMNLVTDGLPALALGSEPTDLDTMKQKPRSRQEKITDGLMPFIIGAGVIGAIVTLIGFLYGLVDGAEKARAMAFTVLVLFELFWVFNCRSETKDVFGLNPFSNKALVLAVLSSFVLMLAVIYAPFLKEIFHTIALSLIDWLVVLMLSLTALFIPLFLRTLSAVKQRLSHTFV